jgi:gliding motility-associated-like protein
MRVIRILTALLFLAPLTSEATHILGGDIQYKFVGDSTGVANQYRVKLVVYRNGNPGTATLGPTEPVDVVSASCNINFTQSLTRITPEFPASNLGAFDCIPTGSGTFLPMVNIYIGYVILPTLCEDYKIIYENFARPAGITSIVNSGGVGFHFEAELNNTITTGPKNSSPSFISIPVSYICTNGPINYLQNAVEINGDSIQYELVPARDWLGGNSVPYTAGYTYLSPVTASPSNPFVLDPQTGNITFTATNVETSVIALRVNEYRYDSAYFVWVKVGSSNREIQVSVAGNCWPSVNAGVALDPSAPGVNVDAQGRQTKDYNCLDSSVTLHFTIDVECISISPDGSDFRLTNPAGQPIPIKALVPNCDVNGETSTLEVKLFKPLSMNGEYYLYSKVGNDGNTLLNKCGKDMDEFDTIVLLVNDCVDLEMELTNVTINEDKHPHVYWDVDTATLPRYLFNMWRVHRSDDGGATYSIVHNSTDTNLRNWEDVSIDANMVDTRVHRYFVDAIVNGFVQPSTDTVKSMWLRGDMTNTSSIPVVWNSYNAWDTAHYQVQFGRNLSGLPGAAFTWSDYGTRMQDTFALVEHTNLPPGQYAVRIKSYRHSSVPTYAVDPLQDTAYSNWIEFGEPVPPIPPIDTVIVPNVITPNGDGRNDVFEIQGMMSYTTTREVTIMNRYGKVIYRNKAYDNAQPWDGKDQSGSMLADGVYFYVIKLYDQPNEAILNLNGSVTILSN